MDHRKKQRNCKKRFIYFCFIDYAKAFDFVDHNKLQKILKEMEITDHLTCPLRNLYARLTFEQCSKLGKEYKAALSPCLFNFYAGCITQNARLDESQAGIKIAERNQQPQIGRLLLFGPSVTSHTLGPHGLQHTRLPCPALSRTLLKLLSV